MIDAGRSLDAPAWQALIKFSQLWRMLRIDLLALIWIKAANIEARIFKEIKWEVA
jgi:hypothetical protein